MSPNQSVSPTPGVVTIELSNELVAIGYARMVMRRVLPPLDEDSGPMFFGAVTEIITNAMDAHQRTASESMVTVELTTTKPESVTVTDSGGGFDPESPRLRSDGHSGMGLTIAHAVVPGLRIESNSSGTTVHLPYPTS